MSNSKSYYMRKKEEKHRHRIMYLLFLLLMTGIMLSTTTYAWFTTNRVVTVDFIDVKVKASGGIEISADGKEWSSIIDLDDLTSVHDNDYPNSVNQIPLYMEPVSTDGSISDGKINMYFGEVTNDVDGNFILTSVRNVEEESNGEDSDGKFLAFDLFLKTSESKEIYFTSNSGVTYHGDVSYGIENAVRIGLIVEGNTIDGSGLGTIQSLSTNSSDNVYLWEVNYDTHTENGVSNARDVYGINTSTTGGARLSYDGVIDNISSSENIYINEASSDIYPSKFRTVGIDIATVKGNTNNIDFIYLHSGITKIRVYVWIEGQDVDCENNASVGDLEFFLQFTTNPS